VYPLSLLSNGLVSTNPQRRRIVGSVIFCAVCVVSKESRRLVLARTYCFGILSIVIKLFYAAFLVLDSVCIPRPFLRRSGLDPAKQVVYLRTETNCNLRMVILPQIRKINNFLKSDPFIMLSVTLYAYAFLLLGGGNALWVSFGQGN
jgi:hypothetical protein